MSKFTIKIETNAAAVGRATGEFRGLALQAVASAMDVQNDFTVSHIVATKLKQRGPKTLGVVSGKLYQSLRRTSARVSGSEVSGQIGTNLKYAAFHEYGTKGPYVIRPKRRRALAFATPRGLVFAREVTHPGLPARAPISTGIKERESKYSDAFAEAIERAWSK